MTYVFAILAGLCGAAAGWYAGSSVGGPTALNLSLSIIPPLRHIIFVVEPGAIGAACGALIMIPLALRLAGRRGFGTLFARTISVGIAVGAIAFGAVKFGAFAYDKLDLNAGASQVEFEIRLPAETAMPQDVSDIQVELQTDKNQTLAAISDIARDGTRPVLHGSVSLAFRTTRRQLVLSLPGEPVRVYRLHLAAQPERQPEYSPWQFFDFLDRVGVEPQRPNASDDIAIRYRVL